MSEVKTNMYHGYFGKEIELTKEEFVKRWTEVATDISKLISWRDMDRTQKLVEEVQSRIKELAEHNFDLKADDVHIHYDMDGKVDYHRIGDRKIISMGKPVNEN
tara:strand:- start:229 stop:540 length:312 start_codon:yes stop_codon:yes gene_type:complete